jgi:hypothetical protein
VDPAEQQDYRLLVGKNAKEAREHIKYCKHSQKVTPVPALQPVIGSVCNRMKQAKTTALVVVV